MIGVHDLEALRRLSDARELTCPGCGAPLVLHAGPIRAAHFAHLPGAVCRAPQTEPETEEHRAGKLLLARWLQQALPPSEVTEITVEAFLPETGQRADVLATLAGTPPRRLVLEYQCANLTAPQWRRRHRAYRQAGYEDLWLLGASRQHTETSGSSGQVTLHTAELERALLWDGAPLLFLDSVGERYTAETLTRFRPDLDAQALRPTGRLSARSLLTLDVPLALFGWPTHREPGRLAMPRPEQAVQMPSGASQEMRAYWLWEWLAQRHHVTPQTVPPLFGQELPGATEVFACEARAWQAALYYRWIHQRVGDGWWLGEITLWSRAYLPLRSPVALPRLERALRGCQTMLAAVGFLSQPTGYQRASARVLADLTTLPALPTEDEIARLIRYRQTLDRDTSLPFSRR